MQHRGRSWLARGGGAAARSERPGAGRTPQASSTRSRRWRLPRRSPRSMRRCSRRSRRSAACRTGWNAWPRSAASLFVNDSKGTTVAADAGRAAGPRAARGADRGRRWQSQDFAPLKASVDTHCRAVVLLGRDAPVDRRSALGRRSPRSSSHRALGGRGRARHRARAARRRGAVSRRLARASTCSATTSTRGERFKARGRRARRGRPPMPRDAGCRCRAAAVLAAVGACARATCMADYDATLVPGRRSCCSRSAWSWCTRRRSRSPKPPRYTGYRPWYFLARHAVFVAAGPGARALVAFQIPLRAWRVLAPYLFIAGARCCSWRC